MATPRFQAGEWQRRPGSARSYVNRSTGEVISRREYDELRREAGVLAPIQTKGPRTRLGRLYDAYREKYAPDLTRGQVAKIGEVQAAVRDLRLVKEQERRWKAAGKDTKPLNKAHGRRAQALEDLGIREEDADYDVGDTPTPEG